jgi:L,D-peptidoglycan transpeptidase YkuD (ErfK/YbiS/YcfS/YnhG family)
MAAATSRTFAAINQPSGGRIRWPGGEAACVFGRGGVVAGESKREGDGATPSGFHPMREVFWRPDRIARPATGLPLTAITPDMGWCDDPASADYNRRVALPFAASHERLWREDHLYDLIVVLGWNDAPPVAGVGSAIFLHVAAPDMTPTEGCVATDVGSLLALVATAGGGDGLEVRLPSPT